jgi:hypothetical protein
MSKQLSIDINSITESTPPNTDLDWKRLTPKFIHLGVCFLSGHSLHVRDGGNKVYLKCIPPGEIPVLKRILPSGMYGSTWSI